MEDHAPQAAHSPTLRFLWDYVKEALPVEVLKTMFLFVIQPVAFLQEVVRHDWRGKSRPGKFLLGTYGIYAVLVPLLGPLSNDVFWIHAFDELKEDQQLEFFVLFPFSESDAEQFDFERFYPGKSSASRTIGLTAGSSDVRQLGVYLASQDRELGEAFVAATAKVEREFNSSRLGALSCCLW